MEVRYDTVLGGGVVREEVDHVEAAVEIVRNPSWGRSRV